MYKINKKEIIEKLQLNSLNPGYSGKKKTIFVDLPEGKTVKDLGIGFNKEEVGFNVEGRK